MFPDIQKQIHKFMKRFKALIRALNLRDREDLCCVCSTFTYCRLLVLVQTNFFCKLSTRSAE